MSPDLDEDLHRARRLAFAAEEERARDLLLSLLARIAQSGREDLLIDVVAELGSIYLTRGANDAVADCIRTIGPGVRQTRFLQVGLFAADGEHDAAAIELALLAPEQDHLLTYATILCARALGEDDLHSRAAPMWERVIADLGPPGADSGEADDHLLVTAATGYGRFCVETGQLARAIPWLHRAGARAAARGWELATARTQLERGAASWSAGDHLMTEQLVAQAYPVIARYARADDVSRCWLLFGLTRMGAGALEAADQCFAQAERHWRELGKPLYIHRILLQRSWIPIFLGRFAEAVDLVGRAREALDSWPRASWLQYARLDDHLGTIWRADGLADLGFDGAGDPSENWQAAQARQATALGVTYAEPGSAAYRNAAAKLERAADLKVPAALAVDSVRYSIADADARLRWASRVAAPMLAGAFAVAWEADNTQLISELIEYHSARGTFSSVPPSGQPGDWATTALSSEPAELAVAAAGPPAPVAAGLTRLGPLPPLRMQPDSAPILGRYRALAQARYHRDVTAAETAWSTSP
ncbi:hypothetical protein [Mycolicibacterium komossense]|uniref:Tetratricopeptide repeat family protein n=1 Tax=Mycolicibacterium komossense TaxID=1779 RepID=A0ABT3CA41_9MYCO|nr:hypothetical protein [Mycolicibacterium komossense]MCV7226349.1 hypothetical protein [Mycolicibacterium komossense]